MKQVLFILFLILPFAADAQVDDMYYVPKRDDAKENAAEKFSTTRMRLGTSGTLRDEDEYNRRGSAYISDDDAYESDVETESVEYEYADDEEDYVYSTRIVRFHSPHRVVISSPLYWDVVYSDGWNTWTVYDDGFYWDAYPNCYSSWVAPAWSWGYSFGGFSLSFGSYYYHRPIGWWHHPHYYHHHWGHSWHPVHHHWGGHFSGRYVNRPTFGNLRTGNNHIGRVAGGSGTVRRGSSSGTVNRSGGSGTVRRGSSSGTVNRSGGSGIVRRGSSSGTVNRSGGSGTVRRGSSSGTVNRSSDAVKTKTKSEEKKSTRNRGSSVRRGSSSESKTYNRPSSTRSTSRSSSVSGSSSRSSVSRSTSGSPSRGAGSSGTRGGGSRGGRR